MQVALPALQAVIAQEIERLSLTPVRASKRVRLPGTTRTRRQFARRTRREKARGMR